MCQLKFKPDGFVAIEQRPYRLALLFMARGRFPQPIGFGSDFLFLASLLLVLCLH
jgi:hypothetical protein